MKSKRHRVYLLILTSVIFLLAVVAESFYYSDFEYKLRTKKFNKVLAGKETIIENCLNSFKLMLDTGKELSTTTKEDLFSAIENQGTILEYFDNKLIHWSDNSFDVPAVYYDSLFSRPIVFIQNGWFLTKSLKEGNERIIALLRIRSDYGFQNDLVKNGFLSDFGLPGSTTLSLDTESKDFQIFSKEGVPLFSLVFPKEKEDSFFIALPVILWIVFFFLLIFLILEIADHLSLKGKETVATILSFFLLSLLYFLILFFGKPAVFMDTELFSPYRFALNSFIPSLGHLVILSTLTAVFAYILYRYFPLKDFSGKGVVRGYFILTILLIISVLLFALFNVLFQKLILDSNISFEPYKALDLSVYSLFGFTSVILLLLLPLFFLLKIFSVSQSLKLTTVGASVLTSLLLFGLLYITGTGFIIVLSIFWLIRGMR